MTRPAKEPPLAPAPAVRDVHVGLPMEGLEAADVAHLRQVYARDRQRLADLTGILYG